MKRHSLNNKKARTIKMQLVDCTERYWEFVRLLRMDKRVKNRFITKSEITPSQQIVYMTKHSRNFRIALVDGTPAGFVGVIDDDIRVCTHPDFQRIGLGRFMITECMKIWPTAVARVKIDNDASIRLFEACGFSKRFYILTK